MRTAPWHEHPCHWGVVNGHCVVVSMVHPCRWSTKAHPRASMVGELMLATKAGHARQDPNLWSVMFVSPVQAWPYCNWVGAFFNRTDRARPSRLAMCEQCWTLVCFKCQPVRAKRTSFNKHWAPTNGRFEGFREFCGGLATMFPNTTLVEVNFSIIGWEKNNYRQNLTDFSLEGIIHANQYKHLHALVCLHARGLLTIQQFLIFIVHLYGIPIFPILAGGFGPMLS